MPQSSGLNPAPPSPDQIGTDEFPLRSPAGGLWRDERVINMTEREFTPERLNVVVVVTGLGLGEETKGATVQWLARELGAHTIIRNGGCQAGHVVVASDGREHMFSHYGCGTFEGARTYLREMTVFPAYVFDEAVELEKLGVDNPLGMMTIDRNCLAVTPYHGAFSRMKEISRGENRRGTVGMGVSEAVEESRTHPELSIRASDFLGDREVLFQKVEAIRQYKLQQARELLATAAALSTIEQVQKELKLLEDESFAITVAQSFIYLAKLVKIVGDEYLDEVLSQEGAIVCEPSHGALHHPWYGFVPHVTQVDPTSENLRNTLSGHEHKKKIIRLGVSRSYLTRHGAGPLPSFSQEMTDQIQETHNAEGSWWLGEFRNGYYDFVTMQYAINISGGKESFNGLVISYLDVLAKYSEWPVVEAYTYEGEAVDDLDQYFEMADGKIIGIKVYPNTRDQAHYDHQVRLTELIKHCKSVVTILKPEEDKSLEQVFLDRVEEKLGILVVAVSRGPKAEDREKRMAWKNLLSD